VLDRVEEARAALGAVSYRLVSHRQAYDPPEGLADHHHRTVEVVEQGNLRRASSDVLLVFEDADDREYQEAGVRSGKTFGVRTSEAMSDVWMLDDALEAEGVQRAWMEHFVYDHLRYGFGTGRHDVATLRERVSEVRTVEREGAP
jgi:hypothetical protein